MLQAIYEKAERENAECKSTKTAKLLRFSRYALPVTGERSLALLKDWNLTLAEERVYARPAGSEFTGKIKRRVDQVRKYLDMIRSDRFRLPDARENVSGSGSTIALIRRDDPIFDREKMDGY